MNYTSDFQNLINHIEHNGDKTLAKVAPEAVWALQEFVKAYNKWNTRKDGGEDALHRAVEHAKSVIEYVKRGAH